MECSDAWITPAFDEALQLGFVGFLCWRFRPVDNNPYMRVEYADRPEGPDDDGSAVPLSVGVAEGCAVQKHQQQSGDGGEDEEEEEETRFQDDGAHVLVFPTVITAAVPPPAATLGQFVVATTANSLSSLARI